MVSMKNEGTVRNTVPPKNLYRESPVLKDGPYCIFSRSAA